jgi:hypothetical protein
VDQVNRSWRDADGDYVPDCDLIAPQANGECGGMSDVNFGSSVPGDKYDPTLLTGFGNRESNWEFSTGVQHEVLNGVSVDVGYFRRIWQNLPIADDLALGANDFDFFSITVPSHPELPDGGGYVLDGFRAIKESAFGRPADILHTLAKEYGSITEHWDGVDVNVNARLSNGLMLQLGTSTGRTAQNDCDVASQIPEAPQLPEVGNDPWRAVQFCDRAEPFLTQFKGYGVYTIPVVDVQVAGTFRSTPGAEVNAEFDATNAYLAANSTLGRALAGGASDITIQLLEPNTKHLDRRNELDIRLGKVLRLGGSRRAVVSLDLYNALNSNAVITASESFNNWLAPQQILNARLAKVSLQFDF